MLMLLFKFLLFYLGCGVVAFIAYATFSDEVEWSDLDDFGEVTWWFAVWPSLVYLTVHEWLEKKFNI